MFELSSAQLTELPAVLVEHVSPVDIAARDGLAAGDVIVAIDGARVATHRQAMRLITRSEEQKATYVERCLSYVAMCQATPIADAPRVRVPTGSCCPTCPRAQPVQSNNACGVTMGARAGWL